MKFLSNYWFSFVYESRVLKQSLLIEYENLFQQLQSLCVILFCISCFSSKVFLQSLFINLNLKDLKCFAIFLDFISSFLASMASTFFLETLLARCRIVHSILISFPFVLTHCLHLKKLITYDYIK